MTTSGWCNNCCVSDGVLFEQIQRTPLVWCDYVRTKQRVTDTSERVQLSALNTHTDTHTHRHTHTDTNIPHMCRWCACVRFNRCESARHEDCVAEHHETLHRPPEPNTQRENSHTLKNANDIVQRERVSAAAAAAAAVSPASLDSVIRGASHRVAS